MSKVKALYHIVFCTKHRKPVIPIGYRDDLYRYVWSEIESQRCRLLRIGGTADHVHILVELNPTVALSYFVQTIKSKSSGWLGRDSRFPKFEGWGSQYYACTLSPDDKDSVIDYIKNQLVHHKVEVLDDELERLHGFAGLYIDANDMK